MSVVPVNPFDQKVTVSATWSSFTQPVLPQPPPPLPCFSPAAGTTKYSHPLAPTVVLSCAKLKIEAPSGLDLLANGTDAPLPDVPSPGERLSQASLAHTRISIFARYSDLLQGPMWAKGIQAFDYAGGFTDEAWVCCSNLWLEDGGIVAEDSDLRILEGQSLVLGPCTQKAAQSRSEQVPGITLAADASVDIGGETGVRLDVGVANALSIVDDGGQAELQLPHGVLARATVDVTQGTMRLPRVNPAPTHLYGPGSMAFSDSELYLEDSAGTVHSFTLS